MPFSVDLDGLPAKEVAVSDLRPADSPRINGENEDHIHELADVFDQLPAILVHYPSLRIIDGMHRFRAAQLLDKTRMRARLIDCDEATLFALAVHANVAHGLVLSAQDKEESATRILEAHPDWSTRQIAATCGLSPAKVEKLRACSTAVPEQLNKRLGRDGKFRPTRSETERRRQLARDHLRENPGATVREIAAAAGISPGTALKVRDEMTGDPSKPADQEPSEDPPDPQRPLRKLQQDPAVARKDVGRKLIIPLSQVVAFFQDPAMITNNFPGYAVATVADALRGLADQAEAMVEQIAQNPDE